jgi:hypothetical protein
MRNTADVAGGKPIAVLLQPISGLSAMNPLLLTVNQSVTFCEMFGLSDPLNRFYLSFLTSDNFFDFSFRL